MKILVTGAKGFVGKNLCLTLKSLHLQPNHPLANEPVELFECDLDTPRADLDRWLDTCDFVFHLAGVNRPKDPAEFKSGNTLFTEDLLEKLEKRGLGQRSMCTMEGKNSIVDLQPTPTPTPVPVLLSSSTQAALDNDYGKSKLAAEQAVFAYGERTGAPVYVYRFANVFGKWCRPNYNSAVATWCYNIAHDLPIQVRDPSATVTLIYIDDLVNALIGHLKEEVRGKKEEVEQKGESERKSERMDTPQEAPCSVGRAVPRAPQPPQSVGASVPLARNILSVEPSYAKTLGEITELIHSFHAEPTTLQVPDQADGFAKKLYATYLSYLPEDKFSYPLTMHCDARGSFTEILHTPERGQVSVNISKPGITKGQHWHHTKHEKFCVVSGEGLIQFRKMDGSQSVAQPPQSVGADVPAARNIISYRVSGSKIEVVRIPPGYTHNIINVGTTDLVTLMWANEVFDPTHPDTYREDV